MGAPHVPTNQQISNLNALKATATTAAATVSTAQATLATANAALSAAQKAVQAYEKYIFGGEPVGAIDIGTQNA